MILFPLPLYCDVCGEVNRPEARFCARCGQTLHIGLSYTGQLSPDHLLNGRRYRILDRLGQGGFGAVYKAEEVELQRMVAVKEMSQRGLRPDELQEATAAFWREAHMLAALHHPSLPRILDYFTDEGRWYLVMDFIEGETLEQYLSKLPDRHLPVEEVLDIGIKLCTVLDYLHTREPSIIFRDLKPANIMLTAEKHLYLIDFGIARHFKPGQTRDTLVLGSPGYAAPEQHGKMQTTNRADIYSLGATLHQLLSGDDPATRPFRFVSLPMLRHSPFSALEPLIMQMVELDEQRRPESMAVVRERLQQIEDRSHPAPYRRYSVTTEKVPLPASAGILTASPIGTTLYTYRGHASSVDTLDWSPDGTIIVSGSSDAVYMWNVLNGEKAFPNHRHFGLTALAWSPKGKYIASASKDESVQVWEAATGNILLKHQGHTDRVNALAWSPDGSRIASAGGSFMRNHHMVQIWDANKDRSALTYHGHTDAVFSVAWSPDGTSVASASKDATVQVWDAAIGNELVTYRGHSAPIKTVSWSPDGASIASGSIDGLVHIWEPFSGQLVSSYKGHDHKVTSVVWSPDSLYVASASEDGTVHIWKARTATPIYTYRGHRDAINALAWSPDGNCLASASKDTTVQVWAAREEQKITMGENT